jgi:hypothetical protein
LYAGKLARTVPNVHTPPVYLGQQTPARAKLPVPPTAPTNLNYLP